MGRWIFITLALAMLLPITAAAHPGWGIVVDDQGAPYFTDLEAVWKIDSDGQATVFVDDVHTHALALDAAGNLVGEHGWYDAGRDRFFTRYWRATSAGDVTDLTREEAGASLDSRDPDGNRYRLENDRERAVILRIPPGGEPAIIAGGAFGHVDGPGEQARFRLFGASTWGPDGLYLTEGGILRRINKDGDVVTLAGPEQGFPYSVQDDGRPRYSALLGLAVADDGTAYFADIDQRRVLRRRPDGAIDTVLDGGVLWIPSGVALVEGWLYVLEVRRDAGAPTRNIGPTGPRVRRLSPGGEVGVIGVADR